MKKALANQIAKLWNSNFTGNYEPTRTIAVVTNHKKDYYVEIVPDKNNVGISFHHHEEMTDVERAFKVSAYVTTKEQDGDKIIIGRFF